MLIPNDNERLVTNKEVYQFTTNGEFIAKYKSCVKANEVTGVDKSYIASYARNKYKKCRKYNFMWRYKEDVKESEIPGSFVMLR